MQFQGLLHTVRWKLIGMPIDYWKGYVCAVSDRVQVHPLLPPNKVHRPLYHSPPD